MNLSGSFKKYASNASWLMLEKVIRMVVGLFVGVWMARYLGPEGFGLLSYAQSFAYLFAVFSTLGLDGIVTRELVKDETRRDQLLGTAFLMKLIGALVIFPIITLATLFTSAADSTNLLIYIIATSIIFQSFNVIDFYYQAKVISKYVAWSNTISLLISSLTKIYFILTEAPLIYFAFTLVLDALILALGLVYFYTRHHKFDVFKWQFKVTTAKYLLLQSWPLILSLFAISVYMKIDQIMIKEMINAEAVGQYAAAVKLVEPIMAMAHIVILSLFPAIVNAVNDPNKLNQRMTSLYSLVFWAGIFIFLATFFIHDYLIHFLYGEAYHQAAAVLLLYVLGLPFAFWVNASSKWFIAKGYQIQLFIRAFFGAVISIILNYLLIPQYHVLGAALATVLTYFFIGFIFDLLSRQTRAQSLLKFKSLNPLMILHWRS